MSITLRPYQDSSVENIRQAYRNGSEAPLLVLPTGGGKTVIFTYIARNTMLRQKRVMILVHRIELMRQTSMALNKFGIPHGLINPMFSPRPDAMVQIASVQTLVNRLNKTIPPDMIIIDEAHHANAGSWSKILKAFPQAKVLGVTATPSREDGSGLGKSAGGWFDTLIMGPQIGELIEQGYLVQPLVYAPTERLNLDHIRKVAGDYDKKQLAEAVDKPKITGDAVAHYSKLCPGAPAVAFCVSIEHAEHVAAQFRAAGYRAYSVDGTMDDATRQRLIGGLANGSVQVLTSCSLISEGTDIPAIGCAILLRPTESLSLFLQQVGRALRPCEGKEHAIILDHVGNVLRHGMPDQDREWSLQGKPKTKRDKRSTERSAPVKQCPECKCVHAIAPSCPQCGHVHKVEDAIPSQVDGELEQISKDDLLRMKRDKAREVATAKSLHELERIEKQRGYKPGWARRYWAAKHQAA